ncbi:hypothetical protein TNCV_4541981 [Trichonephila clavipes]|nr:hypothetical protein TNCV_4541981 [Trichonephila clavipes]
MCYGLRVRSRFEPTNETRNPKLAAIEFYSLLSAYQCLNIRGPPRNNGFTTWKEVNEQNALPSPEQCAHHFPYRQRLFEFRPDRRSTVPPMH